MTRGPKDEGAGAGLSRWSRLKLAAREAEIETEIAAEAAAGSPAPAPVGPPLDAPDPALADLPEAEVLERLGLPDPDLMQAGDDFAAFMQRTVPDFLRRRALRRLWLSNPVLANLDGLIDHGEDYTDAATVKIGMKTLYEVGRGMPRPVSADEIAVPEVAAPEGGDPAPDPAACAAAEADAAPAEPGAPEGTTQDDADRQITQSAAPMEEVASADHTPPRRRRMSFEVPS